MNAILAFAVLALPLLGAYLVVRFVARKQMMREDRGH